LRISKLTMIEKFRAAVTWFFLNWHVGELNIKCWCNLQQQIQYAFREWRWDVWEHLKTEKDDDGLYITKFLKCLSALKNLLTFCLYNIFISPKLSDCIKKLFFCIKSISECAAACFKVSETLFLKIFFSRNRTSNVISQNRFFGMEKVKNIDQNLVQETFHFIYQRSQEKSNQALT